MATLRQFLARLAQLLKRELGARERRPESFGRVRVGNFVCARCHREFTTGAEYAVHSCGSIQ